MERLKKIIYINFVAAFCTLFVALTLFSYGAVAKADETSNNLIKELSVIEHGYEKVVDLVYADGVEKEAELKLSLAYTAQQKPGTSECPVITSSDTLTLDVSAIDVVVVWTVAMDMTDDGWLSGTEGDGAMSPYLFKLDSSQTTLTFDITFAEFLGADYTAFGVKRIVALKKIDSLNAIFFKNINPGSIDHFHKFVSFTDYENDEEVLTVGNAKAAGYAQGVLYSAIDYINGAETFTEEKMPAGLSELDEQRWVTGYADGYEKVQLNLTGFPNYDGSSSGGSAENESQNDNKLLVKIYDYEYLQIGAIQVNVGEAFSLDDIKQACDGALIDTRWGYVVTENGADVVKNWNFFDVVTGPLDLVPKGCTIKIYELDYTTLLGELKVEYSKALTVEEIKAAVPGLNTTEFDIFFKQTNSATQKEEIHVVGQLNLDAPITMDLNLVKHQYTLTFFDNDAGEIMTTARVDAGTVLSQELINGLINSKKYLFNSANDWGTTEIELGEAIQADTLITLTLNKNYVESSTSPGTSEGGSIPKKEFALPTIGSILGVLIIIAIGYVAIKVFINRSKK